MNTLKIHIPEPHQYRKFRRFLKERGLSSHPAGLYVWEQTNIPHRTFDVVELTQDGMYRILTTIPYGNPDELYEQCISFDQFMKLSE